MPCLDVMATLQERHTMTNRIAIVLGITLLFLLIVDIVFFGATNLVFLGKKFFELIEWLAFWR